MMKVVVFTCQKMYWTLPIYAYLFNTFYSELQPVVVAGYEPLDIELPPNFEFRSIAPETYPASEWSTGVVEFLENFEDEHFIWSLEDYFQIRSVDHAGISSLESYMGCHTDVWRVDLTGDRLYSGRAVDCGNWGHLDMIETKQDVPYCLSTQACVMSRDITLQIMKPHLAPWEYELQDQSIIGKYRVMGTRQMPMKYCIGWGTGSNDDDGNPIPNTASIPRDQLNFIREQGWLDAAPKKGNQ